jgi:hypothetical protein
MTQRPPIQRAGATPPFVEFHIRYIVDTGQPLSNFLSQLRVWSIQIPSFQRRIVWREEEIESLLDSQAALFGTVILADFPQRPLVLVDGLQRFATGTALLDRLYPVVLSPTPTDQNAAQYFTQLRTTAGPLQPVFHHNANALRSHHREAIRESYEELEEAVDDIVTRGIRSNPAEFAASVQRMFIEKQIAIDPYYNFQRIDDLTNTFINMNSQGVDLSPVDLLRAKLVDQATSLRWNPSDVEEMENDFTSTFENKDAKTALKPIGTFLDEGVGEPPKRRNIFPDWDHLSPEQVDEFLNFIDTSVQAAIIRSRPYLSEIFECGGFPFGITLLYHYRKHLQDYSNHTYAQLQLADFAGGTFQTDIDCHLMLRAYYRRLIDGTIIRIGNVGNKILRGEYSDVLEVADDINPASGPGPLGGAPDIDWLRERLRIADAKRCGRIFNACLLPPRSQPGGTFNPISFGRRQIQWNIDHLIPKASILPAREGEREADQIANLAPLPSSVNKTIRNNPCSTKLGPQGPYARIATHSHPYIDWLVAQHYPSYSQGNQLDNQQYLVPHASVGIGDDRIEQLVRILIDRL